MREITSSVLLAIMFSIVNPGFGQDGYGSVAGRVVFEGKIPERKVVVAKGASRVRIAGQPRVFPPEDVLDESLLVDEESRGVANVMIWPYEVASIHPRYQNRQRDPVELQIRDGTIRPRVVHISTRQAIQFRATKGSLTNVLIETRRNDSVNVLVPDQSTDGITLPGFRFDERRPVKLKSNLHPWITGWIKINDHPYCAVSDALGMFQVNWLPAGDYRFAAWHERAGFLEGNLKVTVFDRKITQLEPTQLSLARPDND